VTTHTKKKVYKGLRKCTLVNMKSELSFKISQIQGNSKKQRKYCECNGMDKYENEDTIRAKMRSKYRR
jgi:hypothetical protein